MITIWAEAENHKSSFGHGERKIARANSNNNIRPDETGLDVAFLKYIIRETLNS
jgi:hypothetical protein